MTTTTTMMMMMMIETPYSRFLLAKLPLAQVIQKSRACDGTRRFVEMFKKAGKWCLA
jgi:hypothetical protein